MLMLINNEHNPDFMIAIYNHQNGFQVQLIDVLDLEYDEILPDASSVVELGKKYGFIISEIELKNIAITKVVRVENQSHGA